MPTFTVTNATKYPELCGTLRDAVYQQWYADCHVAGGPRQWYVYTKPGSITLAHADQDRPEGYELSTSSIPRDLNRQQLYNWLRDALGSVAIYPED